jgi:hypothetical protein
VGGMQNVCRRWCNFRAEVGLAELLSHTLLNTKSSLQCYGRLTRIATRNCEAKMLTCTQSVDQRRSNMPRMQRCESWKEAG